MRCATAYGSKVLISPTALFRGALPPGYYIQPLRGCDSFHGFQFRRLKPTAIHRLPLRGKQNNRSLPVAAQTGTSPRHKERAVATRAIPRSLQSHVWGTRTRSRVLFSSKYPVPFNRPFGTRSENRNPSQDLHPGLLSTAPCGADPSSLPLDFARDRRSSG